MYRRYIFGLLMVVIFVFSLNLVGSTQKEHWLMQKNTNKILI